MGDGRTDGGPGTGEVTVDPGNARPQWARPGGGEFGWRGWTLVGVIVVSFLVIPVTLVALAHRPELVDTVGLTFRDAYLVLPMIPAILLAVTAVWAALHARRD